VCNYNEAAPAAELSRFDLVVVDSDAHPDLTPLRQAGALVVGYLSLGEVAPYRWYWPNIQDRPWVLDKNPNWDSRMIDIRSQEWQQLVLNDIIPRIIQEGFDGLFLDTIDNAEYLEKYYQGEKLPGAQTAMVQFIGRIRARYPSLYLIMNRGFSLVEPLGGMVDAIVAESMFTEIDFGDERVRLRSEEETAPVIRKLSRAARLFGTTILTLDYFDGRQPQHIGTVVELARKHGFVPYISTVDLQRTYTFTLREVGASK